jgi:putative flippase GtrA
MLERVLPIIRFGVAALLNTLFGYAVFAGLVLAGLGVTAALVLATVIGIAFNFQTSRRLVFGLQGRPLRFVAVYAGVLAFNLLALNALQQAGLSKLVAQAVLALPVGALSFMGQRAWVFGGGDRP